MNIIDVLEDSQFYDAMFTILVIVYHRKYVKHCSNVTFYRIDGVLYT